jgi:putative hydrolase of the HAD superfamily
MIRFVIFDLDETLYPTSNGLMQAIGARMGEYICLRLGVTPEEAHALRRRYWDEYGTTLRGLYVEKHIDPDDYLRYVHDLPLEKFIQPDARLRAMLESIPLPKVIFTNASEEHARRVLQMLGVADLFAAIYDTHFSAFVPKPNPIAYRKLLSALGARGEECAIVEDSARNLEPAVELGMFPILIGEGASIYDVGKVLERYTSKQVDK